MLDINLFREEKGNDPEIIRESQRRRFARVEVVDEIIKLDKEWRQRQYEVDNSRKEFNKLNKEVAKLKISGAAATELIQQTEKIKQETIKMEAQVREAYAAMKAKLGTVGNLIHDSVPINNGEANNLVTKSWGEKRVAAPSQKLKSHVELAQLLGIADTERGADIAGAGGVFLIGEGLLLNQALIDFGLFFLDERGYTGLQPPFFMRKDVMAKCAQLEQLDEELYKVTGEGDDKYLISTAEQPLCAYHHDEWISPIKLPIRYAGHSSCFRKEAASHGRDTLGIFRFHQFEKIEQFCITGPNKNDSWEMLDEMMKNSEDFYQELKLPYQIVSVVSGALNDAAAKKYDLEAWFPASRTYKELVSCSNYTDYLARRLEIRYGQKKSNEQTKQYVHMLSSTLTTIERTICCILENYQREDGVVIPEVLQPFTRGLTFLPFKAKPVVIKTKDDSRAILDINLFREEKGNDPEIIRESQRRRFARVEVVDEIIKLDKEWRLLQCEVDNFREELFKLNKEVTKLKISGTDATELIQRTEKNKQGTAEKEKKVREVYDAMKAKLGTIGNLIHYSVPISNDEANNLVTRTWGEKRVATPGQKLKNHVELAELLDIADTERGAYVGGARGFFLKGKGLLLNQALINYGQFFLGKRGFTGLRPPFLMRKDVMAKCAQLAQFDEELYMVTGGGDDKYLIATAEQPLSAYHHDEWICPTKLPIRYAGYSSCFRKEAGSHGRDTLGIFRVHQFEKIEQFCITGPKENDSWAMLDEMMKNSEDFYQELKLPYRIVSVVSGALNDAAAKKYDLEAWFPASGTYRELVSCSNCTDYQSRRLGIRYGQEESNEQTKQYVHMLNSTLTATERTICCILENYQREDGVVIPEVLRPFMRGLMRGLSFLPFKAKPVRRGLL